jgi:heptaprenyl diphosphate synthase
MQSQDKYRIALLSAYAVGLHSLESLLPTPVPWLRFGFANIITVVTLVLYGLRPALMVTLIRVIVSSLLTGTFLGPGFLLSFGGGITSTLIMGIALRALPGIFSIIGVSILGALFHNGVQLFLAYLVFIRKTEALLMITPFILMIGTLTGAVNGIVSDLVVRNLKKKGQKSENE